MTLKVGLWYFFVNKGKHIYFEVHAQFIKLLKNTS